MNRSFASLGMTISRNAVILSGAKDLYKSNWDNVLTIPQPFMKKQKSQGLPYAVLLVL